MAQAQKRLELMSTGTTENGHESRMSTATNSSSSGCGLSFVSALAGNVDRSCSGIADSVSEHGSEHQSEDGSHLSDAEVPVNLLHY